ncbi:MAG TPA: penicillin-binding protein 1A [Rhizobiales bacterium]|nr:penicillin-binding protein 1A [bacterium BMS3Bbin10]HDO51474.1 penicillin-binding protein 1A [Hyphomicrobiales bacterium]
MDITAPIKPPEQKRRRRRRNPVLRLLGYLFAVGMILFVVASAGVAFLLWRVSKDLPDYEVLAKYEPPVMTRIHASDGSLIAEYATERRIYVPMNAIPKSLVQAFLSAEDKNFYQHGGIDFQGIARAAVTNLNNLRNNKRLVGASTITQQVAKNFLLSSDVTIERKLKEAILAIRIERAFTKEQILELYLNEIFLGLKSYGVAAAALNYWGKSLNELTLSDVAYLAALPKAPNNYHPFRYTERALARRNWVIDRMVENGFVTAEEAEAGKAQPLNVNPRPLGVNIFAAEFFAEEVRRQLLDSYGRDKLYGGGLSVRTTLDPKLQREARKALVGGLVAYDRRHGYRGPVQKIDIAGDWGVTLSKIKVPKDIGDWRLAVVLEVDKGKATVGLQPRRQASNALEKGRDGGIIPFKNIKWVRPVNSKGRMGARVKSADAALSVGDVVYVAPDRGKDGAVIPGQWRLMQIPAVGGALVAMDPHTGRVLALAGGFSFAQSEFDRAVQARRQPGSAFKPFVYVTALDNGYTPASVVLDAPLAIEQGPGLPLWRPQNYGKKFYGPSTLRLGLELSRNLMTVRLAQDVGMPLISEYARRFGVYDNLMPMLSMALGAGETTLLRMTTAYSMLANGGKQISATLIDRIQDRYGRTVWRHDSRDCPDCRAREWNGQEEPVLTDERKQIVDPHSAYQVTSMLEGVVQRGTGTRVKAVGKPIAGKTGTTNDEKDAWFVGFAPDLAVGVFVGFDQPKPMGRGETGSGAASPIFRDFMIAALADKPAVPFRIPPGIQLIRINRKTGFRAGPGDPGAILEAFKPGTQPANFYQSRAPAASRGPGFFGRAAPGGLY